MVAYLLAKGRVHRKRLARSIISLRIASTESKSFSRDSYTPLTPRLRLGDE